MQLGQHIVLAEIFEIGLRFLARGDVGECHLNSRPVALVAGKHGKVQQNMSLGAIERVIDHFTMVKKIAIPELH
ncbi:hypothetical protein D3C73_1648450 [compost metagenome]